MPEDTTSYPPDAGQMPDEEDADAVFFAFSAARDAAPDDRTLLKRWTARYPALADEMITLDLARLTTGRSLSDPLEDGLEDPAAVALSLEALARLRASTAPPAVSTPLNSLLAEASARGLDAAQLAAALRLDRLMLGRLEQRLLDAATVPLTLVQQLGEILGRSADDVAAYLRGGPALAGAAHFRARRAPLLDRSAARLSFTDALEAGGSLSAEDQAYWRGEVDAGVLGEQGAL